MKKQELHSEALLSEKSICVRHFFVFTTVRLLMFFTFAFGVFFFFFHAKELAGGQTDLITFLISFYISSHSSWSKLEQYRLVAIS